MKKKIIIVTTSSIVVIAVLCSLLYLQRRSLKKNKREITRVEKRIDALEINLLSAEDAAKSAKEKLIEEYERSDELLRTANEMKDIADARLSRIHQLEDELESTKITLAEAQIELEHSKNFIAYAEAMLGIRNRSSIDELSQRLDKLETWASNEGISFSESFTVLPYLFIYF